MPLLPTKLGFLSRYKNKNCLGLTHQCRGDAAHHKLQGISVDVSPFKINEFDRTNVCPHRRPSLVHTRAFAGLPVVEGGVKDCIGEKTNT